MKKIILVVLALAVVGMMATSATSIPVDLSDKNQETVDEQVTIEIIDDESESDGLFGWVWVRGFILNPRADGSSITGRAINLHYFEIAPKGIQKGVVRLKRVTIKDGAFIKMSEKGLLGNLVYISGFCRGELEIK